MQIGSRRAPSAPRRPSASGNIRRSDGARALAIEADRLAVEEPLEIRLGGRRFTLTMRTPGHDEELAAGFLLAEGFIESRAELGEIRRVRGAGAARSQCDRRDPQRAARQDLRERLKRNFTISSSCGVCGKTSIEAIQRRIAPIASRLTVAARDARIAPMMREAQEVFAATGGLHAAALFVPRRVARSNGGETAARTLVTRDLKVLREDVGRHNAVDKVIGHALMTGCCRWRDRS